MKSALAPAISSDVLHTFYLPDMSKQQFWKTSCVDEFFAEQSNEALSQEFLNIELKKIWSELRKWTSDSLSITFCRPAELNGKAQALKFEKNLTRASSKNWFEPIVKHTRFRGKPWSSQNLLKIPYSQICLKSLIQRAF